MMVKYIKIKQRKKLNEHESKEKARQEITSSGKAWKTYKM